MDPNQWDVYKNEYTKLAELSSVMYERVVYLTSRRVELRHWTNMSDPWSNDYREWIIWHMCSVMTRYVSTDNYWLMANRVYPHLSESDDNGYHFGCLERHLDVKQATEYKDQFCHGMDRMVKGTRDCIDALDYPWTEVYGNLPALAHPERVISPRSTLGVATLLASRIQGERELSGRGGAFEGGDSRDWRPEGIGSGKGSPRASTPRDVTFVREALIKEPQILQHPQPILDGLGAVAIDPMHIWAFFDAANTLVDLHSVTVHIGTTRKQPMRRWFGIGFESHDVYTIPEGFARNKT
jgi:hypothetical protein